MGNPLSSGATPSTPVDALEIVSLVIDVADGSLVTIDTTCPDGWLITWTGLDVIWPNSGGGDGWLWAGTGAVGDFFYVWTPGAATVSNDYWRGAITMPKGVGLNFQSVTGEFVVTISGYVRPSIFQAV